MIGEADYSAYALPRLFKARYRIDTRGRSLEEEIQKRCTIIRERTNGKRAVTAGSRRFRPRGLMFGAASLFFCVGPFAAIKFLDTINVINDVNGDIERLSGLWALLTLPFKVIVFMIGAMSDAEHVIKWFNVDGRTKI
jgi:hypothetical protein